MEPEKINVSEQPHTSQIEKVGHGHQDIPLAVAAFGDDEVAIEAIGGLYDEMPEGYYYSIHFLGTLAATCLAQMSGYLGFNLPANTLSLIDADLGGSPNIIWVAVVWTLGFAVGLLLVGRLSDIFGRRYFFIGATALAVVGNIIGCTAQSVNQLIATNAVLGFAGAGQLSFNIVLGELVSNKNRGPFNALVLFTSIPFSVFGPPIARKFFDSTGPKWRCSYYLGIAMNCLGLLLWILFYHPPTYNMLHVNGKTKARMVRSLDWIGIFLFSAGLSLFLIGINWAGSVYPWRSVHVLVTMLVGVAVLVAFCLWEVHSNLEYPLIPMRLFRNIKYNAIVACGSVGSMMYYSMTVLWPTVVSSLFSSNVQEVGWLSCAVGGGLLSGQLLGGIGIRYIPRMKLQAIFASCLMVPFIASLATVNEDSRARSLVCMFIGAVGSGYVESLSLSSIALVWEPSDIGLVASVFGCIRTASGAVATALYSSVLNSELSKNLPKFVVPAALEAGLPESSLTSLFAGLSAGNFTTVPDINPQVLTAVDNASKHAYASSFRIVFLITLPFGAIMIVAAMMCPNVEEFLTDDVARKLQGVNGAKDRKELLELANTLV